MFEEYYSRNSSIVWYQTAPKNQLFFCWNTIDITSCLPPKRYQGIFQYIYRKHLPTNLRISQQKKNASQNLLTWIFFLKKRKGLGAASRGHGFEGWAVWRFIMWSTFCLGWFCLVNEKWGVLPWLHFLVGNSDMFWVQWFFWEIYSFIQSTSSANWSQFQEEPMLKGGAMQFFSWTNQLMPTPINNS